jgi:hypothetical protein
MVNDEERYRDDENESAVESGVTVHEPSVNVKQGHTEVVGKGTSSRVAVTAEERRIEDEIV